MSTGYWVLRMGFSTFPVLTELAFAVCELVQELSHAMTPMGWCEVVGFLGASFLLDSLLGLGILGCSLVVTLLSNWCQPNAQEESQQVVKTLRVDVALPQVLKHRGTLPDVSVYCMRHCLPVSYWRTF